MLHQMMKKAAEGAEPEGGWELVFRKALVANWNVDERGGSTTVKADAKGRNFAVTFVVKSEGK